LEVPEDDLCVGWTSVGERTGFGFPGSSADVERIGESKLRPHLIQSRVKSEMKFFSQRSK
jgi:hypothetical protein